MRARIFFALTPDPATRKQLVSAQTACQNKMKFSYPVTAENLHLTLHYVGTVESTDCLIKKASAIHFEQLQIIINQYGLFERARVFWTGPKHWPQALDNLAEQCRMVTESCGFINKPQKFTPHITLARKIRAINKPATIPQIDWQVQSFSLLKSDPTPNGIHYTKIHEFK